MNEASELVKHLILTFTLLAVLLLLLLTQQRLVGFGLLHQFIGGFSVFKDTRPVLHF
jgi:hypothetical protein